MHRTPARAAQSLALAALVASLVAPACLLGASPPTAAPDARGEELFPGVRYVHEVRDHPAAVSLHILTVDLTNPNVSVRVASGGPDPDGPGGRWQTTLLPVPKIAARERFDVAVNGDFFAADPAVDANSAAGLAALAKGVYRTGQRATVLGSAVTDGHQWAAGAAPRPALMFTRDGRAAAGELAKASPDVWQAVTGSAFLVRRGIASDTIAGTDRNARTAAGLDHAGTVLTLVVVDGLVNGRSSGLTLPEMAREMARLGCYDAINLDGGGSSTLVVHDPAAAAGEYRVLNHPTDGKPRPVASALGVCVKPVAADAGNP